MPLKACRDFVESKLPEIPRYRQRVAFPPFNIGLPSWQPDPNFDIRNHIRQVTLRRGTESDLKALASQILSTHLDRQRPLWDLTLVRGLEGNRSGNDRAHSSLPGRWIGGARHHECADGHQSRGAADSAQEAGIAGSSSPRLGCAAARQPDDVVLLRGQGSAHAAQRGVENRAGADGQSQRADQRSDERYAGDRQPGRAAAVQRGLPRAAEVWLDRNCDGRHSGDSSTPGRHGERCDPDDHGRCAAALCRAARRPRERPLGADHDPGERARQRRCARVGQSHLVPAGDHSAGHSQSAEAVRSLCASAWKC